MMQSVGILKLLRGSPTVSQQCWLFTCVAIKMLNRILTLCIRNAEQGVVVEYSKVSINTLKSPFLLTASPEEL